jgi:hypothetical protein
MSTVTKSDLKELKQEILAKISKSMEAEIRKELKSDITDKHIKEIVAKGINSFFRIIWQRSNFWINDIK